MSCVTPARLDLAHQRVRTLFAAVWVREVVASRLMAVIIPQAELHISYISHSAGHVWNREQPDLFEKTVLTLVDPVGAQGS